MQVDAQDIRNFLILDAVATPSTPSHVREGAIVKAVYVELWYIGSSSQPVIQVSSFEKVQNLAEAMTYLQSNELDSYPNKRNLFKITQGVIGDSNTNPVPVFREWIAVPKGKQRMALGDKLYLNIACTAEAANDLEICGTFIYKEYF